MKRKQFSSVWFSLLLLLGGCQDGQEQVNELQPVNVKTMTVVRGTPSDGGRYSGTVEEQNGTPLSFSVAGTVQAVHVRLGQRVAAGQLIATLDDASLRNSHAAAQAALKQTEDAYRRMKELHDKGSLPDIKWVEVQSQVEQARSVEQIAAKNLRDCRLYAPYNGVIAAKNVEVGQNVVPGLSVAQLVSTSVLNVRIAVPETEIASVAVGQSAYITVQALGNRSFKGSVVEKGVVANPLSRSYVVKLRVQEACADLMPGMVTEVRFCPAAEAEGGCVIPARIVQLDERNQSFVWTVTHGKAHKAVIQPGEYTADGVTVLSGLSAGDEVIVEGQQKVCNGTPVILEDEDKK